MMNLQSDLPPLEEDLVCHKSQVMTDVCTISKNAVFLIVAESECVNKIMLDLMIELPELFKVGSFKQIEETVVNYILHPSTMNDTGISRAFLNILKKHLPTKEKLLKIEPKKNNLAAALRTRLIKFIKTNNVDEEFEMFVGCTKSELIQHIENQFIDNMTWENHGFKTWHIDHIEPLCSFDLRDLEQVKKATHFNNLRPLHAKDNLDKGIREDKKKSIRKQIRIIK